MAQPSILGDKLQNSLQHLYMCKLVQAKIVYEGVSVYVHV